MRKQHLQSSAKSTFIYRTQKGGSSFYLEFDPGLPGQASKRRGLRENKKTRYPTIMQMIEDSEKAKLP